MGRAEIHEALDVDTNELVLGIKARNGRLITARLSSNEAWMLGQGLKENADILRGWAKMDKASADA